ncbi:hypothetical protein [Jeotgalibacillus sp. JSM ZJ347]|uniref:hypothetical protein n=1 Tax=Jeotgalibacillus sp. JSM ZJ347 TaxID=3342117 RepID=UPI0035A98D25
MTEELHVMLHYTYHDLRGSETMKPVNLLIILITLMHFSFLINLSVFDGVYDAIVMTINTILFLAAMITFATAKNSERKKQPV